MLLAKEIQRSLVLVLVQFVRVFDAKLRFLGHEVERGVRDVDCAVIGLNAPLVRLSVGQFMLFKDNVPALRRSLERVGIVH